MLTSILARRLFGVCAATAVLLSGAFPARADAWGFPTAPVVASSFTGVVPIANGGTAASTLGSQGGLAYAGSGAYGFSAAGTSGQVALSGGTSAPTFSSTLTGIGLSGSYVLGGSPSLGGNLSGASAYRLSLMLDPIDPQDYTTKAYVDAGVAGAPKPTAVARCDSNVASRSGTAVTCDSVSLSTAGMRVLLGAQNTAAQNGLWVIASGVWTRPLDFASGTHQEGALVGVSRGTAYKGFIYQAQATASSDVVDTNDPLFNHLDPATVTSVGLSLPNIFTVSNSPVTTSGTLSAVFASQTQNLFLASPNGSSGALTVRAIATADIPDISGSYGATTATGPTIGTGAAITAITAGTTGYLTMGGTGTASDTAVSVVPGTLKLRALYCSSLTSPGGSETETYTVRRYTGGSWADTTTTCAISASGKACNDTAHSTTMVAGDLLGIKAVQSATSLAAIVTCTYTLTIN